MMAMVLWGLRGILFETPSHGLIRLASLSGLVGAGVLAYGVAGSILGAFDLNDIARLMSRRRLRSGGGSAISSPPTTET